MRTAIVLHTLRALRSQWWPRERIHAWHEQALVRSMRYACTHVPFYRSLGIPAESIVSRADLQRFPVLTKKDLQTDSQRFIAEGFDPRTGYVSRTSGSTGEPTTTYFDAASWALCKYALKIRRILAVTSPWFRRCLIVSEQPAAATEKYRRERPFGAGFLYRERIVSLFEEMPRHRQAIATFRPDMLYAFPSYLVELLRSYGAAGCEPPRIPVLFTSSEVLTPAVRARLEAGFRGSIYDIFGTTEFKEVAWQCVHGRYHLNFESVFVETAERRLLISSLRNRAMPLLRLDTGDLGALDAAASCPCGRKLPQLTIEMGYEGDVLELPSGRRLSPYLLTEIIEMLPGLHQYRIVHEPPVRLTVQLLAAQDLGAAAIEDCRRALLALLGEPAEVRMERVTRFERGPGGKHKVFVRRHAS